jgi:hypothetical protein
VRRFRLSFLQGKASDRKLRLFVCTAFRPAVPLTPAAWLETSTAKTDRLHQGATGLLLRAVPVKTGVTGKVSGGFFLPA